MAKRTALQIIMPPPNNLARGSRRTPWLACLFSQVMTGENNAYQRLSYDDTNPQNGCCQTEVLADGVNVVKPTHDSDRSATVRSHI